MFLVVRSPLDTAISKMGRVGIEPTTLGLRVLGRRIRLHPTIVVGPGNQMVFGCGRATTSPVLSGGDVDPLLTPSPFTKRSRTTPKPSCRGSSRPSMAASSLAGAPCVLPHVWEHRLQEIKTPVRRGRAR